MCVFSMLKKPTPIGKKSCVLSFTLIPSPSQRALAVLTRVIWLVPSGSPAMVIVNFSAVGGQRPNEACLKKTWRLVEVRSDTQMTRLASANDATRNGHIYQAAILHLWCSVVGDLLCQLSIGDPSKITQTSKSQKLPILLGNGFAATANTGGISEIWQPLRNRKERLTHSGTNGGCLFAADPDQAFDRQSIFWAPEALSTVLSLREGVAPGDSGQYDLDLTTLTGGEFRHGLDGWHSIVPLAGATHRFYLPAIPAKGSPLLIELPLDANSDIRLQAAHRFWCAIEGRRLGAPPLALSLQRRRRFVLTIRALDGWLAGHSYREIAEVLFGKERVLTRSWKDHDLRSLTIRLVKNGTALMRGGYRALLRSPNRKK
jgi:hypothetical protein